ncbi:hypothetical protein D3C87_1663720 [compost metagenome]
MERKLSQFPEPAPQITDFLESVRTREKFALNEENGYRSCTLVNMGLIALRLNRSLKFDSTKDEFINDDAANRLVYQPMRGPWSM